jgi:hypothetical protein
MWVVLTFQRAIYGQVAEPVAHANLSGTADTATKILPQGVDQWWYLWHLSIVIAASLVLFLVALQFFGRTEGDFAEEL